MIFSHNSDVLFQVSAVPDKVKLETLEIFNHMSERNDMLVWLGRFILDTNE